MQHAGPNLILDSGGFIFYSMIDSKKNDWFFWYTALI